MPGSTPSVTLSHRLVRSDEVLFQNLDGEAVLLDLASETYFGLNEVGTRVWELLEASRTLGELSSQLQAEYDVEAARAESDVIDLATRLVEAGLASAA